MDPLATQLHGISKGLKYGDFNIPDIGDIVPASLMIQDLDGLRPIGCSYMNNWGCEHLGSSVEEVNQLGEIYYERYFVKEETYGIFQGMNNYLALGDFDKQYNFFQRVKLYKETDYTWFYTVLKVVQVRQDSQLENKIILLSSPVIGMDQLISRVNKTLDQDQYIRNNYRRFAELTTREKEIVTLLANGKSSNEIADQLFISSHTVSTHRKNIIRKIECKSFADLLRFAMVFDLV
ncbi:MULTISPECIES: LuxR C-terminal-related transcriptional regulator [Sphingobacterium]|uniref:LuxR C-terminal-related transcriptional regulator n=1 Tax=Sphingobacterium TaxID=28453 RepID=UPI0013DA387C|nr:MULTISPECIES: helix-turn-helix transcriptional regulator [unclassified Sphingobacterium]